MTSEELDRIKRAEEIQLYTENRCEALEIENKDLKAYNEKLLDGDIEKHNKIVELEKELAKRAEQIEALNKDKDYFSDALDKQIKATYKVVEENNELKRECRRCIHTDCPCILSDYGKDRNGICDHFKDVFDENAELKEQNIKDCENFNKTMKEIKEQWNKEHYQLTEANKIILTLLNTFAYPIGREDWTIEDIEIINRAEKFIKE